MLSRLRSAGIRSASGLYGLGALIHRTVMRRTAPDRGRLACAVVSVGGLTVGGAGKTPVAARLALLLHQRGWRVAIASRGYKGRSSQLVTVVSDGKHIRSTVAVAGDESFVLSAHAPGVPVLVGRDRRIVGHHAVSAFDTEILILDDGFQHHRLSRDLDIVCVDGVSGFGNQHVLPAGPLREGRRALAFADWLCVVDGDFDASVDSVAGSPGNEAIHANVREGQEIIRAKRHPTELIALNRSEVLPLEVLRGRHVGLVCGVARPASVRRTLESLGAIVVSERRFPDHHQYRRADLADLGDAPAGAELAETSLLWLTTEKDALKILPKWAPSDGLFVLRIEALFDEEQALIDRVEARLRAAGRLRRGAEEPPSESMTADA